MPNKIPESSRGNRRPALLAAARELFFERGYAHTTVEQVARLAGFSKRTVYLNYKNKDDLFISLASEGLSLLQKRFEAIDIDGLKLEEAVRQLMEAYIGFACDEPDYYRIIFHEATADMMANVSLVLRKRVEQQERACLGFLARVAQRAIDEKQIPKIDPLEIAVIFWGAATGIILLSLGGSQTVFTRKSREELIKKATWILYSGFMNPPPQFWEPE